MSVGDDQIINLNNSNAPLLKHAFLYKQKVWEYENEIRVVKNLKNIYTSRRSKVALQRMLEHSSNQTWSRLYIERSIYCLDVPSNAFVSVHLGKNLLRTQSRKYDDQLQLMQVSQDPILNKQKPLHGYDEFVKYCHNRNVDVYSIILDRQNWSLQSKLKAKNY